MNLLLRSYVDICSKRPKGWQVFMFYILPIGTVNLIIVDSITLGKQNDLCGHLASLDSHYRQLFFTPEWKDIWDRKNDSPTEGMEY